MQCGRYQGAGLNETQTLSINEVWIVWVLSFLEASLNPAAQRHCMELEVGSGEG